jgi:hypothetical protein
MNHFQVFSSVSECFQKHYADKCFQVFPPYRGRNTLGNTYPCQGGTGMREPLSLRTPSRIKGRPALVRRLRGLVVAVNRFGRHRARSREDVWWSARTIDALSIALEVANTPNGGASSPCSNLAQETDSRETTRVDEIGLQFQESPR